MSDPGKVIPAQVSHPLLHDSRELLAGHFSLAHARTWLNDRIVDGEKCPCCGQLAKIYRRRVHHTIARALIDLHFLGKEEEDYWVHVPSKISPACEVGKARYWELVEEQRVARPDGGRAGWWRLTDQGEMFVRGLLLIPVHVLIYDGRALGFEGEMVSIVDCLGSRFSYNQLMART